jgi:hypothetical protein
MSMRPKRKVKYVIYPPEYQPLGGQRYYVAKNKQGAFKIAKKCGVSSEMRKNIILTKNDVEHNFISKIFRLDSDRLVRLFNKEIFSDNGKMLRAEIKFRRQNKGENEHAN